MEHEPTVSPEVAPGSFDKQWFTEFKEAGGAMEAYDYLDGNKVYRDAERAKFESGEIENPKLDYPKLDLAMLEKRDEDLVVLKSKIIEKDFSGDEKMETVQQVYRWKINEKLAQVRLLKASASGDMKRFARYSEFVYGKPDPEIFAYEVQGIRAKLEQHKASDSEDLRREAQVLDDILPKDLPEPKVVSLPDQSTFDYAKNKTMAELGHLVQLPGDQEEFSAQDIQAVFDKAIADAKIDGWKTVIDPNKQNISASQENKTVFIPETRKVNRKRIEELILHEIGTHALRRANGERSKLMLLGLGLDRYQDDEGITGLREQILDEKVEDFSGLMGHFVISLANGADGTPRDFREVHTILKQYLLVEELVSNKDIASARKNASLKAWNHCVRTFRGSDCKTKGASFNKDILYREANIGAWEVVKNNPEELVRFSVGKYDPANSRHVMILDQLGITDEDLRTLE